MTEKSNPSLETVRDLFKQSEFEQARQELETYLANNPDDDEALALQRHLDNLDTLKQINRAIYAQDWDEVIRRVEAAIEMGLRWDIELYPLEQVLQRGKKARTEAAELRARSLITRAEQAEEEQARELYQEARDLDHLPISLRAQIQDRLGALRSESRATISTEPTIKRPDVLMEQVIGTILKKSRPILAEAIRLCAIPFWFDLELLTAMRASDDGLDEKILKRMERFSFVHKDDRGCYAFNEDVRRYLLREWDEKSERFIEANRRAQFCFLQKLKATALDNAIIGGLTEPGVTIPPHALAQAPPQADELIQAYLYHLLAVDADAGIALLRQLFHAADEAHHLALAQRFVEVADEQRALLDPDRRAHIDYMRGLLDYIQGDWEASRDMFERMLCCEGLPATLQARVRRALSGTLVQQEQWGEAIDLAEQALAGFEAADDDLESALTMINLGQAHLDLALNIWGGGETFRLRKSWIDRAQDLAMFVNNLPILFYLMARLGVGAMLPVLLRVGREIDWVVARLFVTAAEWFNRAEAILRQLDDLAGLERVQENLAWLYLLLGHFRRAENLYRDLLSRENLIMGEYRVARARLGLAQALVRQGRLEEAREILEQILPVFGAYRHTERVAQTHTTLAQTFALEGQPAQAVTHYQQAIQLCHQLGNDGDTTEVLEQMRLLEEEPETDAATKESIAATSEQIVRRRYQTRFMLPQLQLFRLLALIGLGGVFLFTLFSSIRIESGTDFGVGEALLGSQQGFTSSVEPSIQFELMLQMEESFKVDFVVALVIGVILIYLILYAILGLWLTMRTSLKKLQEEQQLDIVVDEKCVSRGTPGVPGSLSIRWDQVGALLSSDRSLLREPVPNVSRFVLFSEQGAITVDGQTRRYLAARNYIQQRLNQPTDETSERPAQSTPTYNFGFSVIYSHMGRLFLGTAIFILAFIITSQFAPGILRSNIASLPYSLADLYSISYLGLLIPVGWWLALSLRERLFLKPHTRRVWLIGGVGLVLAVFTVLDQSWLRWAIGRPNVAPGLFAAFLMGLAAYYIWTTRRWEQVPFEKGEHVYSWLVRLVSGGLALVLAVICLNIVGREVAAYHNLALADSNRSWAIDASRQEDDARAQELYEQALSHYDRALDWVDNDADTYHSRGVILTQLGRYEQAVESIKEALRLNPRSVSYLTTLAITYERWAKKLKEADDDAQAYHYYQLAHENYTAVIQDSKSKGKKLISAYLSRAGVSSQLGEYYRNQKQPGDARRSYEAARDDYAWVLQREPRNANAISGQGWMAFRLAELDQDAERKSDGLEHALDYFEEAISIDPRQVSAWTGQGHTYFAISEALAWEDEIQGRTRSACADTERNPRSVDQARTYQENVLTAIESFEHAATLDPQNAGLYSVQGYLYFNLVDCPDVENQEVYLAAAESFGKALEIHPDNYEWRLRRANLYYVLIDVYEQDYYAEAIADYEALLAQRPDAQRYWLLGSLYRQQGNLDQAVANYARAVEMEPDNYRYQWLLGWYAYLNGDYERSVEASRAASSLDPTEPRTLFNAGLALVAQGEVEEAWRTFEMGVDVAEALVNPQVAVARYDEALGDLEAVVQDPANVATALRAYLTFKKGLVQAESDAAEEARQVYEDGITLADEVRDRETRQDLYDEALEDLRDSDAQAALVRRLTTLLEAARDR